MYGQGKTRGRVALLGISAATTQNTGAIEPGSRLHSEFLWHFLMGQYEQLRNTGNLGHLSHLNLSYVRDILIPLPSLEEQQKVAQIAAALQDRLVLAKRQEACYRDLFSSTLHQLMTGQLRVTEIMDAEGNLKLEPGKAAREGNRADGVKGVVG